MCLCEGCLKEFDDDDYLFHHVTYDDNDEDNYLRLCSDCSSIFYKALDDFAIEKYELKKKLIKKCFPKILNPKLTHPFLNHK